MADFPDHHCPGCATPRKAFPRYPWHFCNDCRESACDRAGRKIIAGNVSASGGFAWRFEEDDPAGAITCRGVIALIRGRPVVLREARFGGIVAEPLTSGPSGMSGLWDLTGDEPRPPRD
ncbi:hypothetical protein [Vannielia sp.]|uniref:hypothetical protein n=1 Tax=Vannielia sp. TaxID=2813045 RepID=UPI002604FC65|nr:hypothetical protein [Vannielia sp.]MDF1872036.1 hypothetical protein [Vannielia sp.]